MSINIEINKEDLQCCICLDDLSGQVYNCVNGPHYTCHTCKAKIYECPICKNSSPPVRNLYLEQSIKKYIVECPKDCSKKIFNWSLEKHDKECANNPMDCICCKRQIIPNTLQLLSHLENFCNIRWSIQNIDIQFNKIKYTSVDDPFISLINKKIIILSYYKKDEFLINFLTDDVELMNTKIKLTVSNNVTTTSGEFYINSIQNLKKFNAFHKSVGKNFIFEFEGLKYIYRNNNSTRTSASTSASMSNEFVNQFFGNLVTGLLNTYLTNNNINN